MKLITLNQFQLEPWDRKQYVAVKEAVLPFDKFPEESIFLSPEMKSTGEVMGISRSLGESFSKALISAGNKIPKKGVVFISVNNSDKLEIISIARDFIELGFTLIATKGTYNSLVNNGLNVRIIYKVGEGRPNIVDQIKNKDVHLVINTPMGAQSRYEEEEIGKSCIKHGVLAVTTLSAASAVIRAIRATGSKKVKCIQSYYS